MATYSPVAGYGFAGYAANTGYGTSSPSYPATYGAAAGYGAAAAGYMATGFPAPPDPQHNHPPNCSASLSKLSAYVSSKVGRYCRVLVGDARFRAQVVAEVSGCVLRWISTLQGRVYLYGRRAWNAHLSDAALSENTVDVDLMVHDPAEFTALGASLWDVFGSELPHLMPIAYGYVKAHQDGRGSTMTVEVGGTPLVDLTCRMTPGDFCLFGDVKPFAPPFALLREVELPAETPLRFTTRHLPQTPDLQLRGLPSDLQRSCVPEGVSSAPQQRVVQVSVLRVHVMMEMLRAEANARHWRCERASREISKYRTFLALGFLRNDLQETQAEWTFETVTAAVSTPADLRDPFATLGVPAPPFASLGGLPRATAETPSPEPAPASESAPSSESSPSSESAPASEPAPSSESAPSPAEDLPASPPAQAARHQSAVLVTIVDSQLRAFVQQMKRCTTAEDALRRLSCFAWLEEGDVLHRTLTCARKELETGQLSGLRAIIRTLEADL